MSIKRSDIRFGIEIETCIKDDTYKGPQDIYSFGPVLVKKLNNLIEESNLLPLDVPVDKFVNLAEIHARKIYDNHTWMIDEDVTLSCNENDFITVEIITPVMSYEKSEIQRLENIFKNVLNKFKYETNETQGIHINISHPQQNVLKFLQMWWYFEPLIIRFLPYKRQIRLTNIAKPLREIFPTFSDIKANYEKYYKGRDELGQLYSKYSAVSVKDDRFEIRIIDPSMDVIHILYWTEFCCSLLYASIKYDITDINHIDDLRAVFGMLFFYIKNQDCNLYFQELYNRLNSISSKK